MKDRLPLPIDTLPDTLAPPTSMLPDEGRSSPPIRLRSVVLPDPDGPMRARKSPCGISRFTP